MSYEVVTDDDHNMRKDNHEDGDEDEADHHYDNDDNDVDDEYEDDNYHDDNDYCDRDDNNDYNTVIKMINDDNIYLIVCRTVHLNRVSMRNLYKVHHFNAKQK